MDLLNTLPGNSSVNTIQHATVDNAVFYVVCAKQQYSGCGFSAWSMPRGYKIECSSGEFSSVWEAVKKGVSCKSAVVKRRLYV
jgi:hypothetical protein